MATGICTGPGFLDKWTARESAAMRQLLILTHVVHSFRRMLSIDSDPCRPAIPTHVVHGFRRMPSTSMRCRSRTRGLSVRGSRAGGRGAG